MKKIDYKDTETLKKYLDNHSRIQQKAFSGIRVKNQRRIARAIKNARFMALLPYISK